MTCVLGRPTMKMKPMLCDETESGIPGVSFAAIENLLTNSGTPFDYLGGNRSAVLRQWTRLKLEVMKDSNLRTLKYHELCER